MRKSVVIDNDAYIFECPHCNEVICIYFGDVNCKIFRHGWYIKTNDQIDPHSTEYVCKTLKENNLIYGCGKPFRLVYSDPPYIESCEYI